MKSVDYDGKGMPLKDGLADMQVALQTLDSARQHELGLDVELFRQLPLPLLGQGRRAEDRQAPDLPTVE